MSHNIDKRSALGIMAWINDLAVKCKYICDDFDLYWGKGFTSVSEQLSQLHTIATRINVALVFLRADGYVVREHKVDTDTSVSPSILFFIDEFDDGE